MRKSLLTFVFIFLFSVAVSAQTPTATPPPVEDDGDVVKISTMLIQIDVTVTDKKGKVITDLKPEEIEIYENGEKQEISNFSFISNIKTADTAAPKKPEKADKNAVPLPPNSLKPENVRRTVALVVDDLSLSFESTYFVQQALKKFVNEQMQEGDLVAIIRTGAGIGALQQFTSDKRQLLAAIEKVRWNPVGNGGISAFAPIESPPASSTGNSGDEDDEDDGDDGATNFNNFRESVFATGTLGAVNFIIRGMKDLPGRKSVMLLSDGFQIFERSANGSQQSGRVLDSLRRLVDLANRSSVVVYTMDARGLQTVGLTAEDNVSGMSAAQVEQSLSDRRNKLFDTQSGLVYLAKETGGLAIYNNNDLSSGIEKMLDDQSYYLIGYQPDAETFDPAKRRFNKLTVKVKRDGARVRYRSGFFGIQDDQIKAPTNLTAAQRIQTALTSPFAVNDVALRLNTLFGNEKQGSYVRSLLHVNAKDLKFVDNPDGSKKATFDVLAVSFGDNGTVVDQISKNYTLKVKGDAYEKVLRDGFVYYFTFPVKKGGAFQYRVAIRDTETNKVGSANQFIEVPNLKKSRLTLSGIVLENYSAGQWKKLFETPTASNSATVSPTSTDLPDPLTDTSLRRFRRATILRYAFEVYNAKLDAAQKPNLTAQIKVFRDGKPILEGKDLSIDLSSQNDIQRVKSTGAITLGSDMTAGEYVLQIIVTDNLIKGKRRVATQFVQFEIQ